MRVRTPVGDLPWWVVVGGNALFWPTWTAAVGFLAQRAPARRFAQDDVLTRLRPFERDGDWYRQEWAIGRWKDRLPEAGAAFGGFAKRSIGTGGRDELERFVVESRRAEHAHWGMVAGVVVTCAWNPWWALPVNGAVAAGSNVPCIAAQRYNRARLLRVLRRKAGF